MKMDGRLEQYKAWYRENYLHDPPAGRIESFCKMHGIVLEKEQEEPEGVPESFWRGDPYSG